MATVDSQSGVRLLFPLRKGDNWDGNRGQLVIEGDWLRAYSVFYLGEVQAHVGQAFQRDLSVLSGWKA